MYKRQLQPLPQRSAGDPEVKLPSAKIRSSLFPRHNLASCSLVTDMNHAVLISFRFVPLPMFQGPFGSKNKRESRAVNQTLTSDLVNTVP